MMAGRHQVPEHLVAVADPQLLLAAVSGPASDIAIGLRKSARRVTDEVFGREVFLRGLVEVSNICARNCAYCGLRTANRELSRYRMDEKAVVARAELVAANGLKTLVMQAGEKVYETAELCRIIRSVKRATGLVITLSFGEFSRDDYFRLRDAGGDRYLLRHETSDPDLYARLHPGYQLADRLRCLDHVRDAGFEVGSGFMVGLPGQTPESLLGDIGLLVERRVEMAGIGPFIANPKTPLDGSPDGNVEQVLNMLAILRHALPGCNLPATTALDSLAADGRERGIEAGANVVMPVMTPAGNKERYVLYPNKRCLTHDPVGCIGCSRRRLIEAGYIPSDDAGWSRTPDYPSPRPVTLD